MLNKQIYIHVNLKKSFGILNRSPPLRWVEDNNDDGGGGTEDLLPPPNAIFFWREDDEKQLSSVPEEAKRFFFFASRFFASFHLLFLVDFTIIIGDANK